MYWLPLIIKSLLPGNSPNQSLYSILLSGVPFVCSAGEGGGGACAVLCCAMAKPSQLPAP
jgi:hypothetical protein